MYFQHPTNDVATHTQKTSWITSAIAAMALGGIMLLAGGCAQSEKTGYVLHLTAVIDPEDQIPDEVIAAFDLDRKQVPTGAVAAVGQPESAY